MRIACWLTKATEANSEYVILIDFPTQKWLRERALVLHLYVNLPVLLLFLFRGPQIVPQALG